MKNKKNNRAPDEISGVPEKKRDKNEIPGKHLWQSTISKKVIDDI